MAAFAFSVSAAPWRHPGGFLLAEKLPFAAYRPKAAFLHAVTEWRQMKRNVYSTPAPASTASADILTDLQASAFLAVEPRTLRDWRHKRGLPHIKLTSKVIRYRRSDLDAWLSRHAVTMRTLPS